VGERTFRMIVLRRTVFRLHGFEHRKIPHLKNV
jgi:hypothetical protein